MRKIATIALAGFALLAATATGAGLVQLASRTAQGQTSVDAPLPACETEDQLRPSCRWDAQRQGDGTGMSFTVQYDPEFDKSLVTYDSGTSMWVRDPR